MAAVSIPPSPHNNNNTAMSTRRAPLTNISNANNSPYRAVAAAASKRSRSHSSVQRELHYAQQPPSKKQMLDLDRSTTLRTPPRQQARPNSDARGLIQGKSGNTQSTALDRKLAAAREKQHPHRQSRAQPPRAADNLDTIRQWQSHYRKVFPQIVFYFESIPEDVRIRCARQITSLGAVCDLPIRTCN